VVCQLFGARGTNTEEPPRRLRESLAVTLYTLCLRQNDAGVDANISLRTAEKSVTIFEGLSNESPSQFGFGYARGLQLLSAQQGRSGNYARANASVVKAIGILRPLMPRNAPLIAPELSRCLHNLSDYRSKASLPYQAVFEPLEEAIKLRRSLAKQDSLRFVLDLVSGLRQMAHLQHLMNNFPSALSYITEAVDNLAPLTEKHPRRFNYEYALCLDLLALEEACNGRPCAFSTNDQAIEILRRLDQEGHKLAGAALLAAILNGQTIERVIGGDYGPPPDDAGENN
jgi:hypothetical protein